MHKLVISNIDPDVLLFPACPEKNEVTQLETFPGYFSSGFSLEGCRSGNCYVENLPIGDLDETGTINASLTGSPKFIGSLLPGFEMPV